MFTCLSYWFRHYIKKKKKELIIVYLCDMTKCIKFPYNSKDCFVFILFIISLVICH